MVHRVVKPRPHEPERTARGEIPPQESSRHQHISNHTIHVGKGPSRKARSETDPNTSKSNPRTVRSTEIRTEDPLSSRSLTSQPTMRIGDPVSVTRRRRSAPSPAQAPEEDARPLPRPTRARMIPPGANDEPRPYTGPPPDRPMGSHESLPPPAPDGPGNPDT
jgi:hypothetical protein